MTLTNKNKIGGVVIGYPLTSTALSFSFSPTSFTLCVAVLLLVATTAGRVEAAWNHSCTAEQMVSERRGHVCGSNIPKTLQLICGRRGTADRNQQQQQSCRGRRDLRPMTDEENSVFLSKERALASLHGTGSKRSGGALQQGIVCECCVHQCALRELQQYCNPCVRRSSHSSHWPGHSLSSSSSAERGKSGEAGFGSSSKLVEDV